MFPSPLILVILELFLILFSVCRNLSPSEPGCIQVSDIWLQLHQRQSNLQWDQKSSSETFQELDRAGGQTAGLVNRTGEIQLYE